MTLTDVARAAYTAYGETTGHKNFQGNPMPDWADLGDTIQQAWYAAARASYYAGYLDARSGCDSLVLTGE